MPVTSALSPQDKITAKNTFQNIAASVAAFERSGIDSPFSSKYDKALCGQATLSAAEQNGLGIFMGKGQCNNCHSGAVVPNPPTTCATAPNLPPLFTNFKSVNIGVPKDPLIPFLLEDQPDAFGFVANPLGRDYIDNGVGDMLRALDASDPTNPFATLNPSNFDGKFLVPTLRNITRTPKATFIRSYAHNGEFKSIEQVIHYHVTRDTLGGGVKCKINDPNSKTSGFGTTCWPAPEQPANMDTTVGNLPLSLQDEQDLVTFLDTLNDLSIGNFP
jgi:cytochrome c peroxidase